jgi:hypothetical protein
MGRIIAYIGACILLLAGGFTFPNSTVGDLCIGGFLALLLPLGLQVFSGRVHLRHFWYSIRYRNQEVRVSAAYLFRIKVSGKYLLIKGSRFPQYQPVGGVFKVSSQGSALLQAIGARDDDLIGVDATSTSDLRIRIQGKHLRKFYSWYDSREGREDSPWREFYEELVVPGIVPASEFPFVFHNYKGRVVDKIRTSEYAGCLEILIADIYELLPTTSQEDALKSTMADTSGQFRWFDESAILRRGAISGEPQGMHIAAHARKIL